jgi:hypothetical protein
MGRVRVARGSYRGPGENPSHPTFDALVKLEKERKIVAVGL